MHWTWALGQASGLSPTIQRVIWRAPDPSVFITQTSILPVRLLWKAMREGSRSRNLDPLIVHRIELGTLFWRETFPNNIHSNFIERPTRPPEPRADIIRARITTARETLSEALVVRIRFNAKARIFVR
jgi:hypothetical protein